MQKCLKIAIFAAEKKDMSRIVYDPRVSVDQLSRINGVSTATIRKYIREMGIDRRFDEKWKIYSLIRDLQRQSPAMSIHEMARRSGYSLNTVKKYLRMEALPEQRRQKYSAFDMGKTQNLIKSVSTSQSEILQGIITLHLKDDHFGADLTYSKGVFWKKIKEPELKFDLYPQKPDVRPLEEAYALPAESLQSIIVDLPFLLNPSLSGLITERFSAFVSEKEMYEANRNLIFLSHHLLRRHGILVMKTMDSSYGLRQLWVSDFVVREAERAGFQLLDKFILTANKRPISTQGQRQHHARKFHSYFFVFRK